MFKFPNKLPDNVLINFYPVQSLAVVDVPPVVLPVDVDVAVVVTQGSVVVAAVVVLPAVDGSIVYK